MSSAGIQKLFCGIYSTFKCSFDEFVGEKVFSPSYSSSILAPPGNIFLCGPLIIRRRFCGQGSLHFNSGLTSGQEKRITHKTWYIYYLALRRKMFGVPLNTLNIVLFRTSSVQFSCSVVSDSLWPHESQHARPPCPSPTPGVHSNLRPSSQWCHPAISLSVVPFSSCP